jgi:protein TonB
MRIILLLLCLKIFYCADAQKVNDSLFVKLKVEDSLIRSKVVKSPEFIGGEMQFAKYLRTAIDTFNWSHYFEDSTIRTKIVIRFIVNEDGTASDVYVYKSIQPEIDAKVVAIIRSLPKFSPGLDINEKPVRSVFILPLQLDFRWE